MAAPRSPRGCEDPSRWVAVPAPRGEVLRAPAGFQSRLEALDQRYREVLPVAIGRPAEKHWTRDEPKKLLACKLARGRFRPRLRQLATSNPPGACGAVLSRCRPPTAVTDLGAFHGVGPVTASVELPSEGWNQSAVRSIPTAVLVAGAPEAAASVSDEAVATVPGRSALRHTLQHCRLCLGQVQECVAALSRASAFRAQILHLMETALWI